ncbi:MAG TPA: hypothetical protein PKA27_02130 [Fimbriimonadaceae bacterium]|nr:hypothetical protein [Fimbriimonadaceae bacterium]
MNHKSHLNSVLALIALATTAQADLSAYSQNFESMNMLSSTALSDDGWLVYGNVFDQNNNYLYGYGSFPAPNGTGGFSSVATGEGGAEQGTQYINIFSDYNNGGHAANQRIEANVFQEQVVGSANLGKTYRFTFDYKASFTSGPAGATTTFAFIKVLNPSAGYSIVANPTVETTTASTTNWVLGSTIDITIDPAWTGHLLQFGFVSTATLYQASGVYYDNLSFAEVQQTGPSSYSIIQGEEFEGGIQALLESDDQRVTAFNDPDTLQCEIEIVGTVANATPSSLTIEIEQRVDRPGLAYAIKQFNYVTNGFQVVSGGVATLADTTYEVVLTNSATNYVRASDKQVVTRVALGPINDEDPAQDGWLHGWDRVDWTTQ